MPNQQQQTMADASNSGPCVCGKTMSINRFNKHSLCRSCIGHECNLETRCQECQSWSDEHMTSYVQCLYESANSVSVNNTVDDAEAKRDQVEGTSRSDWSDFKKQMEERFSHMMSDIASLIDSKLEQNARNKSLSRPNIPKGHGAEQREFRPSSSSTTTLPGVSRVSLTKNNLETEPILSYKNKGDHVKNKNKSQIISRQRKTTTNQRKATNKPK